MRIFSIFLHKMSKEDKNISNITDILDMSKSREDDYNSIIIPSNLSNYNKLNLDPYISDIFGITNYSNNNIKPGDLTLEPLSLNNTFDNKINISFNSSNSLKSDIFCATSQKNKMSSKALKDSNLEEFKSEKLSNNLSYFETPLKLHDIRLMQLEEICPISDLCYRVKSVNENNTPNKDQGFLKSIELGSKVTPIFDKTSTPLFKRKRLASKSMFSNKSHEPKKLKIDRENKIRETEFLINKCSPISGSSNFNNILLSSPTIPLINLRKDTSIVEPIQIKSKEGIKYNNKSKQSDNNKPKYNLRKGTEIRSATMKPKILPPSDIIFETAKSYNLRKRKPLLNDQKLKEVKYNKKKQASKEFDSNKQSISIVKVDKNNCKNKTKSTKQDINNLFKNINLDSSMKEAANITRYQINSPKLCISKIDNLYSIDKKDPMSRSYKLKSSAVSKNKIEAKLSFNFLHNLKRNYKNDETNLPKLYDLHIENKKRKVTLKLTTNKISKPSNEKLNVKKINVVKSENQAILSKSSSGKNDTYNLKVIETSITNKMTLRSSKTHKTDDQKIKSSIIGKSLESSKSKVNENKIKPAYISDIDKGNNKNSKARKNPKYGALINLLQPCKTQENDLSNFNPVEQNNKKVAKIVGGKRTYKRFKSVKEYLSDQVQVVSRPICSPKNKLPVLFPGLEDKLLYSLLKQSNVTLESSTGDSMYGINQFSTNSSLAHIPSDTLISFNFATPKTGKLKEQHDFILNKKMKSKKLEKIKSKPKKKKVPTATLR